MKYALLNYSRGETSGERRTREMHPAVAAVLERPNVSGWLRLQPAESATTVRLEARKTLLTDGPFVDSKEFLGGFIIVEADDLDGALAVATELQELDITAAIEVRPVFEQELGVLEDVFRDHWGRVLATLVGLLGDIELAEDAAQEAFALAAERWPRDGEPDNPTAWLITSARNRATDRIRRNRTLANKTEQLGRELRDLPEATMDDTATVPDERLELIFTCCHPALAPEAQVALTLRTLGGLSTEEVATAFLVPFETMSKRLSRAKRKIREAAIPFAVPPAHVLPERLDAVLAVIYLVFNQGWGAGRIDLAAEAIRLGQVLAALMPDESEALALLALMLINDSRRHARFRDERLVLLDDQDRSLWNEKQIADGRALLERATALHEVGAYVLQAAIADLHIRDPRDWEQIALLYGELSRLTGSPVVEVNRAVAIGELAGPEAALAILDALDLDHYRYLHSTRAALLRRAGRDAEARRAYERAIDLTNAGPEQEFLTARLSELLPPSG